ncbi:PAQR family membrane homeostasis protein TrhA [Piscinibacter defluvii]|uniref:PAQR family membrane homeostasis protein TrhA n=1 Tax=Piscinibacter defluvii TaxID=1796922 RepID=UPI000FDE550F|nr:hemolysin III family protein [Piscinibacter defluvii]
MDLRLVLTRIPAAADRVQSRAEEWANTLSHGLGIGLALLAWPMLAEAAQRQSGTPGMIGVALFCATMLLQYLASTVYHALPPGRAKQWARAVDHAAIFVFIAGSSSPFTLGLLQGPAGVATCALVWSLALAGVWLKLHRRLTNRRLSTGVYILLGWLALLAALPGLRTLDPSALAWLLGGGLAYLLGSAFFMFDASLRFGHFVWHLFVLAGSGCHVCAALWPALG